MKFSSWMIYLPIAGLCAFAALKNYAVCMEQEVLLNSSQLKYSNDIFLLMRQERSLRLKVAALEHDSEYLPLDRRPTTSSMEVLLDSISLALKEQGLVPGEFCFRPANRETSNYLGHLRYYLHKTSFEEYGDSCGKCFEVRANASNHVILQRYK